MEKQTKGPTSSEANQFCEEHMSGDDIICSTVGISKYPIKFR